MRVFMGLFFAALLLFTGCSEQGVSTPTSDRATLYASIEDDILSKDYEGAYDKFRSFESEYRGDVNSGSILIRIADGYSQEGDSEQANKLYNRYIERYASESELSDIYYKKIDSYVSSLGGCDRNQILILQLLSEVENYEKKFKDGRSNQGLERLKKRLKKRLSSLDEHILDYYERQGDEGTVRYYKKHIYNGEGRSLTSGKSWFGGCDE